MPQEEEHSLTNAYEPLVHFNRQISFRNYIKLLFSNKEAQINYVPKEMQ